MTRWTLIIDKPARIKIEFLPVLMNVPFIAIILYILFSNASYWSMFNSILAGVFHLGDLPYIEILLGIAIGFGLFTIIYGLTGMFKLEILHKPALNAIPSAMLAFMTVLVIILLNINVRVNLDYLFFMLGPETGFIVYVGASLGIFVLVILLVVGIKQLKDLRPDEKGLINNKVLHPMLAAVTTIISAVLGFSMILAIGFYYPRTTIYWDNVIGVHTRYVDWGGAPAIVWYIIIAVTVITSRLCWRRLVHPADNKTLLTKIFMKRITCLLIICHSAVIVWFSADFEMRMYPALPGLSIYPATTLSLLSFVSFINLLWVWKLLTARPPVPDQKIYRETPKLVKQWYLRTTIKVAVVIGVLFVPYWFVFYQPIVAWAPRVDVPFQARLVNLAGVDVPFAGDIVYPGFELQSNYSHEYLNLSGTWRMQRLYASSVHSLSPRTENFIRMLTDGQHEPSYNDAWWETVTVPSPVSQYNDEVKAWGVCWYRRNVTVSASYANKSIWFKFMGVNYFCDVWIDGTYVGYHEGGFTSFAFDVSSLMTPGSHLIAIRIDNPQWDIKDSFFYTIQPNGADFFNYGGIVRELYLEAAPVASISRVDVRETGFTTINHVNGSVSAEIDVTWQCLPAGTAPGDTASLSIGVYPLVFENETALKSRETWLFANKSAPAFTGTYVVTMIGINSTRYAASRFNVTIPNLSYWSTKQPALYAVMVNLTAGSSIDLFCTQTGFRNFTTEGTELRLNGAPLKLAGVSIHEQYPEPTGRSLSDSQRFWDLQCVNKTRSNWWRGSYPFHPMMYLYSDRLGISCWEEAQIFWCNEPDLIEGFSRGTYSSIWIEMLYRDYNRPCILMWSGGNEPWSYEYFVTYLRETKSFLDTHDPNRILAFACVSSQDWTGLFRNTPLRIVTPNCYGGTFEGIPGAWYNETTANLQRFGNNNPGKPIVNMEFGYWRDSTNNQSRCFLECFRAFTENPRVQGFTWWLAFDYYGSNYYNGMGVYNMARTWHQNDTFDAMVANYTTFTAANM
nr:glycoside hydrolase family 2 TIM barrel-domain containing protein [Candidatus Sigynarchaeota archaeon]